MAVSVHVHRRFYRLPVLGGAPVLAKFKDTRAEFIIAAGSVAFQLSLQAKSSPCIFLFSHRSPVSLSTYKS